MKRTKKNSVVSSAKAKAKAKVVAKVKELAVKPKAKAVKLPRLSLPKAKVTEKSTVDQGLSMKVEPFLLEGVVKLDEMTFKEQANLIFDPLTGINPKYMIGGIKKLVKG